TSRQVGPNGLLAGVAGVPAGGGAAGKANDGPAAGGSGLAVGPPRGTETRIGENCCAVGGVAGSGGIRRWSAGRPGNTGGSAGGTALQSELAGGPALLAGAAGGAAGGAGVQAGTTLGVSRGLGGGSNKC